MTMQAVPGMPLEFPAGVRLVLGAVASTNVSTSVVLLDAADEACAQMCIAPKAGNIDRIKYRLATVTTGATLNVALEAVGSNGLPAFTKSLFGTNTEASSVVAGTDDDTWKEVTLTASGTVTRDQPFAIVIRNPNSSPGNLNIATRHGTNPVINSSGARVRAATALGAPPTTFSDANQTSLMVAFRYDDGTWHTAVGTVVFGSGSSTQFNSGSTTNRRGNRFQVPFKTTVDGAWAFILNPGVGSEWYIKLYDDSGTELATSALIDGDYNPNTTNDNWWPCFFTTAYTLSPGTWYRIAMVPNNANNVSLGNMDCLDADIKSAALGGANVYRTLYTSGAWVDTGTAVFEDIILMLSEFDDATGGGGGTVFVPQLAGMPGMVMT